MTLEYDRNFAEVAKNVLAVLAAAPRAAEHDVSAIRSGIENFLGPRAAANPTPSDIQRSEHKVTSYDGAEVMIYRFAKKDTPPTPGPAVVHIHGGGLIGGSVEIWRPEAEAKVSGSGVQFFSVEYRLAPEHPFPTPAEDCYAALEWVQAHATEFHIDPMRVAVMGDSAGGGLAAGLALMARDRKFFPPLAKQILVYPMIDARNIRPVAPELQKHLFWTVSSNLTGWAAYLGDKLDTNDISPYASPALADSVEGLPPTYIDVGGLDLFRDESIEYATRLAKANVQLEFHLYPGVPHAFEAMAPGSDIQTQSHANIVRALKSF